MVWLTWRQWRNQALAALAAFVALACVLAYTGRHLVNLYHASGITACQKANGDCGPLIDAFTAHYPLLHSLGALIILIPAVLGAFWGAPLVARELEAHTSDVAWTQGVTRTRWLATKMIMIGLGAIATTAAFMLIVAAWSSPLDKVSGNRFSTGMFAQRGVAPLAYAAFAFALGVVIGAVARRVLPAMAATLLGFGGVRFAVQQWIRPHLAAPLHISAPIFGGGGPAPTISSSAWIVTARTVDAAGRTVEVRRGLLRNSCNLPEGEFSRSALRACAQRLGIHEVLTVQPAHRYWPFQLWEAGIFAVLAAALVTVAFLWVRRRIG
jgi:hypothetical protein